MDLLSPWFRVISKKLMSIQTHSASGIKIFLDGADRKTMLEMAANSLVQGFTTNPTLMRKAGVKDYRAYCQELLTQIRQNPISFEVFADQLEDMQKQAVEIASWGSNVYVKIPIMNSEGKPTTPAIRDLSHRGIKLNVTAVYTIQQIWEAAQALKDGAPSFISVFAGRMADCGHDPIPIMISGAEICRQTDPNVELLWASTREAFNIIQAEETGCKIITAPADVIKKAAGFHQKGLQQLSLETVRIFKADSESAGFAL